MTPTRMVFLAITVVVASGLPLLSSDAGAAAPGTSPVEAIRLLTLPTNDLVYDPLHNILWASVPSRAGPGGNSVVAITPETGALGTPIFVGSEPNKLAISRDSTRLFVGLNGASLIRVVTTTTGVAGRRINLGSDSFFGPRYAEDIAVLPGSRRSIAVSRRYQGFSPRHAGVAIFDGATQRPTTTPGHTGSNVIEFSNSASTLYGYNNESTEFGFRTMAVTASGVAVTQTSQNIISGFNVDIEFDRGNRRIYATSGAVVNPRKHERVGTIGANGPVEPDSANGLVFYLVGFDTTRELKAFDATTFVPLGSMTIDGVLGVAGSLVRWGTQGIAFRTSADQVFLIDLALTLFSSRR